MNIKFLNNYTLASYFVFGTIVIGIINIFIHGLADLADLLIAIAIIILRYFSFVLVKRSFTWSKYLLIILLVRSIYRLWYIIEFPSTSLYYVGLFLMILQIIFTILALSLITRSPAKLYKGSKKDY